jgi:predicted RecB family nuclease
MDAECILVTENVVRAYSNCVRKAYLLMFERGQSRPIDYEIAMEHRKARARELYLSNPVIAATLVELSTITQNSSVISGSTRNGVARTPNFSTLSVLYRRVAKLSTQEKAIYEPVIFTSSNSVRDDDRIELGFSGTVLSKIQGTQTQRGMVIFSDAREVAVRLSEKIGNLLPTIRIMEEWSNARPDPPSVVLNKHCSICEFQHVCRPIAEMEDSISQLGRISEKELARFEKKGIFTVKQLSYLFRPRKRNLRGKVSPIVHKY